MSTDLGFRIPSRICFKVILFCFQLASGTSKNHHVCNMFHVFIYSHGHPLRTSWYHVFHVFWTKLSYNIIQFILITIWDDTLPDQVEQPKHLGILAKMRFSSVCLCVCAFLENSWSCGFTKLLGYGWNLVFSILQIQINTIYLSYWNEKNGVCIYSNCVESDVFLSNKNHGEEATL